MDSKISIIVPVYQVENELSRCIDSLLRQTHTRLEIILVDDGSLDRCPQICDEYALKDKRILVIHKENGGLSSARNTGLRASTGKYILYVDADDYLEPVACEKLLAGIENTSADFAVGALKEFRGEQIIYQRHTNLKSGKLYNAHEFIKKSIEANEWYAPAVLNLYRKSFLIEHKLYYKEGRYYEDMEMLPRLYLIASTIVYVDFAFYNYIVRADSIMTSSNNSVKTDCAVQNYVEWKAIFDKIEDLELRKALYGMLIRCYLKTCRSHDIYSWKIPGVDFSFALKYAIGIREKIKTLIFQLVPKLYSKLE